MHDKSVRSGLLAEARLGALRMQQRQARFTVGLPILCTACGTEVETMEHVLLGCKEIHPQAQVDTLSTALGCNLQQLGTTVAGHQSGQLGPRSSPVPWKMPKLRLCRKKSGDLLQSRLSLPTSSLPISGFFFDNFLLPQARLKLN